MMVVVKVDDPSNSSDQPCRNSGCEQRKQWDLGHPGHTHTHTHTHTPTCELTPPRTHSFVTFVTGSPVLVEE